MCLFEPFEDAQIVPEEIPPEPCEPGELPGAIEPFEPVAPPEPDELAELKIMVDGYLTQRELAPHRLAHFAANAYDRVLESLRPFRRLGELQISPLAEPDGTTITGVEIRFFEYAMLYHVRVDDSGETAEVALDCNEGGTFSRLSSASLRFGEGEWDQDPGRAAFRHTYDWLVYILN